MTGYFKPQNVTYLMAYAVNTVENLFHGVDICSLNSIKFISCKVWTCIRDIQ